MKWLALTRLNFPTNPGLSDAKPASDSWKNLATISKASSRKLSYKQKFALETLPQKIAEAEKAIAALEAKLADPGIFARDPAAFNRTAGELEKARAALSAMEEEWLELEMLREEIEG